MVSKKIFNLGLLFCFLVFGILVELSVAEETPLVGLEKQMLNLAYQCKEEIVEEFNKVLSSNTLTFNQLFDTFYIPIPNTIPQKYNTQYDKVTDERLRIILDKYLDMDSHILFVVAVDRNGYLPTHNSKYTKPLRNDRDYNAKNNRTKRLFNDRTGLAAARNIKPYLLQQYERDTGESFYDLSVPIFIKKKHWGGLRIGFKK